MKNSFKKKIGAYVILLCMVISLLPVTVLANPDIGSATGGNASATSEIPADAIRLSTPQDVLALAESCRVNSWSVGKNVVLTNDIDMSEVEFTGIPTFGGIFRGEGHTISGIQMQHEGSVVGFFRYLQKTAVVEKLTIKGVLLPEGSHSIIGGFAGKNAGSIYNCSFEGIVAGAQKIGGFAGVNEATGIIEDCSSSGMIYGNHFVGGIAGENQGTIRKCTNKADINTQSVQNSVELQDITLDSLINTESAGTTTDIGGIVGINTGVVRACVNYGKIGYQSMGYNIGGIVGTQSGYVVSCVNYAAVQGRKEVGGIVGHMEPNIVVEFDEDTLQKLSSQMSELEARMKALESSIEEVTTEIEQQMNGMEDDITAVEDSIDGLKDSTEDFSESMEVVMKEVEVYADAVKALMDEIEKIAESEDLTAINNKIEELEKALDDLETSLNIDEVMTNYEKVSTLVNELLELVGSDDSEGSKDINDIIDEMQEIIEALSNADNLEDVRESVERLSVLLDDLQEYLDKVSSNTEEIRTKLNELSTALEQLSDSMNMEEVRANFKKVSTLIDELTEMIDSFSSTNLPVIEEKLEDVDKASENLDKALNDEGLSANYDRVVASTNNLGSALENLSTESKKMTESLEDVTSGLADKLEYVTDQIEIISATMKNVEDGIQLTLEDVSDEDTQEDLVGKVSRCTNYGAISGDLNIGGIAGVMAEENDLDEEDDADFYGNESLNISGKVRAVIRECENYGTISANKQYVGGIVGYMVIGAVLDSFNIGSLDALNADYVGGIAGDSNAVIRGCSSKCVLAGNDCVGGIAGQGNEVTGCYAFVDILAYTEKAGAILGDAKTLPENEKDIVANNYYYVSGTDVGGIDGISYKGATDKKSLEDFLSISDLPAAMKIVEIRFVVDGQDDVVHTLKVGETLTMEQIPALSVETDSEYEWELIPEVTSETLSMGEVATVEYLSEDSITNILFNQKYKVAFDLKDTVISSTQRSDKNLSIALAEGTFAKNTTLELICGEVKEVDGKQVVESWKVVLSKPGVSKLHYLVSKDLNAENLKLYVQTASGKLEEREYIVEGSYIIFDFADGETGFALVEKSGVNLMTVILVAAGVILITLGIIIASKNRKKQESK